MGLLRYLPGADRVLAAHGPALPQPDQLCGPFSAWAALHAVTSDPTSVTALAVASGTRVWPHDVAAWRPAGAPALRTGWLELPEAATAGESGTTAVQLSRAVASSCPDVAVVAAAGDDWSRLPDLLALDVQVGVVANVRTGPIAPPGTSWDVGHFVVLVGVGAGRVLVADTYGELGASGEPPGCRQVGVEALGASLLGRGILLLVRSDDEVQVRDHVRRLGLAADPWPT